MATAPKMQNINGAANSYLKAAVRKNSAAAAVNGAIRQAPKDQQQLVSSILNAVRAEVLDSDSYQLSLDSRSTDVILGRIATLLDQYKKDFVSEDLTAAKDEILKAVNGLSFDSIIKSILVTGIAQLFDDSATKNDIEELKQFLVDLYSQQGSSESKDVQSGSGEVSSEEPIEEAAQDESGNENTAKEAEPETVGDYNDDTIAENFSTLQSFISAQVQMLNDTIAKISKAGIGSKVAKMVSNGFKRVTAITGNILSKVKSASSTVLSIGKSIASGTFAGLSKTVGFIAGAVGSIGAGIGAAMTGIKSLAGGIAGMGKKIGGAILSPFKKIGGFFSGKKKDKAAERKEKMKEKFMSFMMGMFEKLWNFLEPILSKLKIFMLAVLLPIVITAFKVLVIIAAITALAVGLVLAYLYVKNVLIPKLKKIFDNVWQSIKDFGNWLWDKICAIGEGIWYIISFKWLVDFGKWLWEKLCEFGNWIMDTFIRPYIIDPFKKLQEKLAKLLEPVMKKLQPFIESLQNLAARIQSIWKSFKWDESKSFFENLKCLAVIVKDAVLDWWETSPFNTFYKQYLQPIIFSVRDLISRIQTIWQKFKWDESKSFVENLKDITGIIKQAIIDWWNEPDNPVRAAYNKYLKPVVDKIIEIITPIIEKIKSVYNAVADKLAQVHIEIPIWGKDIYPFAPLKGMPFMRNKGESAEDARKRENEEIEEKIAHYQNEIKKGYIRGDGWDNEEEIRKLQNRLKSNNESIAQMQTQNAMNTVNSISNMKQETNIELQKTGEEVTQRVQAEKAATQTFQDSQSLIGSKLLNSIGSLTDAFNEYKDDPNVVPLPMPYGPQRNPAMMEE